MNEKVLNVRIPAHEFELLARYAEQTRRSKSEIVRDFLRSLERKLERPAPHPKSKSPPGEAKGRARA
jgi:Ribbon-helix-helix protein, copG family